MTTTETSTDAPADPAKDELQRYLQAGREALLWKLDGTSEYDARRPMTPTGTNLLGLVKHLSSVEAGYLGATFGRPLPDAPGWFEAMDDDPSIDMWASRDEARDELVGLYRRVWAHGDETIAQLALTDTGTVPWWPADRATVTLHRVLVHLVAEVHRHAGHADIVREAIDGTVGLRVDNSNLAVTGHDEQAAHRARVQAAADAFR